MENSDIARQLSTFRKTIDNIDAALIHLLAERFRCTDEVGLLKARYQLPAVDEAREQQQYQRLAALAQEAELDTAIVQRLMQLVIGEVVERHRQIAARHAPTPPMTSPLGADPGATYRSNQTNEQNRMKWPTIEQIRSFTDLPYGYSWDYLKREEINVATDFFRTWFPSISVGLASPFLDQQFYADNVVLEDDPDRGIFATVVRQNDEIVAIATWEKIDGADVIFGRVGAVAKPHRQARLAVAAQDLGEKIGTFMGAGLIYGMATTRTPYMQQALEQAGYKAVGIMPGLDREETAPGIVRRVYEVIYVKRLAPHADFLIPTGHNLTPTVARLYADIFQGDDDTN
ncbi:chorismate mutase [Pseudomonas frederiksbergensis]|jgi:monofunctional chorismate mutase|uniref:chorismate mutase n=1 Tax=Pseudomonas frederiksbergensis TaxID=104087 RepID=UPI003D961E91